MMCRIGFLIALLALAASLVTPPAHAGQQYRIEGWGRARWGMTAEQIRAAYPAVQSSSGTSIHTWNFGQGAKPAGLVLRDVPVAGPFEVMFFFENSRLHDVVLRPQAVFTRQQALDVAQDLHQQYGAAIDSLGNQVLATAMIYQQGEFRRVQLHYDSAQPQSTYIVYDYMGHFAGPGSAPQRPANPNL